MQSNASDGIQIRIYSDAGAIEALAKEAGELVERARSGLPFHQLAMPLTWWKHFQAAGGEEFGARRGRNFLGVKSWLEALRFVAAFDGNRMLGLLPLVLFRCKVRGAPGDVRVLTFCGDSVLMAYQDFLLDPVGREDVAEALARAAIRLLSEEADLLFLGYMPEDSAALKTLRRMWEGELAQCWKGGIGFNQSRGGVQPWTLGRLQSAAKQALAALPADHPRHAGVAAVAAELEGTDAGSLLFASTRANLEAKIREAAQGLEAVEAAREAAAKLLGILEPAVIPYFHAPLPSDPEAYWATLGKSSRGNLRRLKRRFEEDGGSFEALEPSRIAAQDIDDYLRLHRLRWGSGSAALSDATLGFHRELSATLAGKGLLSLFFAGYRGQRIASHSCIDAFGRREGFFLGRDPAFEKLGAGSLLCVEPILDGIAKGFREYNFGHGGDEYKTSLAKAFTRTWHFLLSPPDRSLDWDRIFTGYERIAPA
jgi:hypothetical protein